MDGLSRLVLAETVQELTKTLSREELMAGKVMQRKRTKGSKLLSHRAQKAAWDCMLETQERCHRLRLA